MPHDRPRIISDLVACFVTVAKYSTADAGPPELHCRGRQTMATVTSKARFRLGWSTWILIAAVLLVLAAAVFFYVL